MENPVACGRCGYEWTYSGAKHPRESPGYQVTCPKCKKPTRFEDALQTPVEDVPEPTVDPFEERIVELHDNTVFTRKQCEVIALKEADYRTHEIARRMGISGSMVTQHESNIRDRIDRARRTLAFADEDESLTLQTGHGPKRFVQIPLTPETAAW
jgi:DNA-binding CsgD family transcriptional regulator